MQLLRNQICFFSRECYLWNPIHVVSVEGESAVRVSFEQRGNIQRLAIAAHVCDVALVFHEQKLLLGEDWGVRGHVL